MWLWQYDSIHFAVIHVFFILLSIVAQIVLCRGGAAIYFHALVYYIKLITKFYLNTFGIAELEK